MVGICLVAESFLKVHLSQHYVLHAKYMQIHFQVYPSRAGKNSEKIFKASKMNLSEGTENIQKTLENREFCQSVVL